jgi:hypothetical protein
VAAAVPILGDAGGPLGSVVADWRDGLPHADPSFEVATVHDAEHQDHPVFVDGVVHQPIIADTKTTEDVPHATDGLYRFTANATLAGDVAGQLLERSTRSVSNLGRQLLECSGCRWCQLDAIRVQASSDRLVVRPLA